MRIKLTSIMVDDQEKALRFYTDVLGFKKKHDIPVGEYRWITVTSPESPDDLELVLEPNANPSARTFQEAMFRQEIPLAAFEVGDLAAEFSRLSAKGVAFTKPPTPAGAVSLAIFADTCGNLNSTLSALAIRRSGGGLVWQREHAFPSFSCRDSVSAHSYQLTGVSR